MSLWLRDFETSRCKYEVHIMNNFAELWSLSPSALDNFGTLINERLERLSREIRNVQPERSQSSTKNLNAQPQSLSSYPLKWQRWLNALTNLQKSQKQFGRLITVKSCQPEIAAGSQPDSQLAIPRRLLPVSSRLIGIADYEVLVRKRRT